MDDILNGMNEEQLKDVIKHVVRLTEDGVALEPIELLGIIKDIYLKQ